MQHLGTAYVIAGALYAQDPIARNRQPFDHMEEALYNTVNMLPGSDEFKADFYARCADALEENTPFSQAVSIIASNLETVYG